MNINTEEYEDAEEIIEKTNRLAQKFYRRMLPWSKPPSTMHSIDNNNNRHANLAWEMACEAHQFYFEAEDPAELLDQMNDCLNGQIDPCDLDKAARLNAA